MRHRLNRNFSIGDADWNALKKGDYLDVADFLLTICKTRLSDNVDCTISVRISSNGESEYTPVEFKKFISSDFHYSQIGIGVYWKDFCLSCTFSESRIFNNIYATGSEFTLPELEEMADSLKQFIEDLYARRARQISLDSSNKVTDNNAEPTERNAANCDNKESKKLNKCAVFWTVIGAVAAVLGVVFPLLIHFGLI